MGGYRGGNYLDAGGNRRIFPNDESAIKALFLSVKQASGKWKMIHHWKPALQTFQVMFGEDRVPVSAMG